MPSLPTLVSWAPPGARACYVHAQIIFDSVCHFSYVLTNFELIGVKKHLGKQFLLPGKHNLVIIQFFHKS